MRTLAAVMIGLALVGAAAGADSGSLHSRLARTFHVHGVLPADSTAMVVALPSGRVVFARNADLSLEPASNEKLSVTYAALVDLGATYRFPTAILGQGRRVGDTWEGRLVLKGSGDPSLTSGGLNRLVNILWREGIRHVTGGVAGDESAFDTKRTGPGWLTSFAGSESPPLSALIVDRGAVGRRLVANPALAAASRLDQLLKRRGITARGAIVHRAGPGAVILATIYSDPLSKILQFMDHWSDNFTAEMVLKAIGLKAVGSGSTVAGADVVKRDLRAADIPLQGVRIADGSGLSRDDRVTARELTSLLVRIWDDPSMRKVVWNALAVAGQPGTLQNRLLDNPKHALLRGKTGTTDISSALSGYVGTRFAFVTIENGDPVDYWAAHSAEDGVADALLDDLGSN